MSQVVGLPINSHKPITNTVWVRARLCKLQKRCTRPAAASDKAYQLLAYGRWFSPGTPAYSTTKTGSHDIAEILLKLALNTNNQSINQSIRSFRHQNISPSCNFNTGWQTTYILALADVVVSIGWTFLTFETADQFLFLAM